MTRYLALLSFFPLLFHFTSAEMPGENSTPTILEVSDYVRVNPTQRAEITTAGGFAVVHGILTSVGMSYCTVQDPHSFESMTCGFDPAVRAEYYAQRPGSQISLIGVPVVASNGQLTLSQTRIYDSSRPLLHQDPVFQNAVMETTNIPTTPGVRESGFAPAVKTARSTPPVGDEKPSRESTSESGSSSEGSPQFIRRAVPRKEGIGRSASLYIGGTFAQMGSGSAAIPTSTATGFSGSNALATRSQSGMTIGAKFSYTMTLKNNDGDPQPIMPGLEGELLYSNFNYRGDISNAVGASAAYKADFSIFALMGNGTMKFNLAPFFPYVGAGGGLAYVSAQNVRLTANTVSNTLDLRSSDEATLAGQAFAGLEYILSKEWSIFGEYKYLHIQDLNLNHNQTQLNYDYLGLHYLNIGVRNYF